jgi:AhpD family alkylhydroperoxidase
MHTAETAPAASKPLITASVKAYGMLPGLHAVMAEAPGLLEGYQKLHQLFVDSSFDAAEKTVVWQAINVEHACHYCVPAHTGIAHAMKVDQALLDALRNESPIGDAKLEALRTFTLKMVRKRGEVSDTDVSEFFKAGYSQRHVLDVILGLAQKVMSNYTNHVAKTPVDAAFQKFAWTRQPA